MPFGDGAFDAVVASSVFEHDVAFWITFREMCRVVRPGGTIYDMDRGDISDITVQTEDMQLQAAARSRLLEFQARSDILDEVRSLLDMASGHLRSLAAAITTGSQLDVIRRMLRQAAFTPPATPDTAPPSRSPDPEPSATPAQGATRDTASSPGRSA